MEARSAPSHDVIINLHGSQPALARSVHSIFLLDGVFSLLLVLLQIEKLFLLDHPLDLLIKLLFLIGNSSLAGLWSLRSIFLAVAARCSGGRSWELRVLVDKVSSLLLLCLQLHYLGQQIEVARPGWDLLVVEIILGDNNLRGKVAFVFALHFSPAKNSKLD